MSIEAKRWGWYKSAVVALLVFLGLHMWIMHMVGASHWFAPYGTEPDSEQNTVFRDGMKFFAVTNILLLAFALYHGLYGLRTMIFEVAAEPGFRKGLTFILIVVGLALAGLGSWGAIVAHQVAVHAAR